MIQGYVKIEWTILTREMFDELYGSDKELYQLCDDGITYVLYV
jgi:hypothetical protein